MRNHYMLIILLAICTSCSHAPPQGPPAESTVAYCTYNLNSPGCPAILQRANQYEIVVSDAELQSAKEKKKARDQDILLRTTTWYGKVVDVQKYTHTYAGTGNAGAAMGATLGQARYLDTTNLRDYSATRQVGAGLLGVVLGSMLDTPEKTVGGVYYWVNHNGMPIKMFMQANDGSHIPVGTCVKVSEDKVSVAPPELCLNITEG